MTQRELRARWLTEDGSALAEEIIARLIVNRGLDGLGVESTSDGLLDLRCFLLPIPARLERFERAGWFVESLGGTVTLRSVILEGVDFSGANLVSMRFHDTSVRSCRFNEASCRDWRMWGSTVADCSFTDASLRDSVVGSWHDGRANEWMRVNFARADFRVAQALGARFADCDFSNTRLTGVDFAQCDFARCRFSGAVDRVLFDLRAIDGRPTPGSLSDVSFSGSVFSEVEFLGVDLKGSVLPSDPDLRLLRNYACIAREALDLLGDEQSLPARMLRAQFENRLRMSRPGADDVVSNRRDYLASGGEELAVLADEVLRRAEQICTARGD